MHIENGQAYADLISGKMFGREAPAKAPPAEKATGDGRPTGRGRLAASYHGGHGTGWGYYSAGEKWKYGLSANGLAPILDHRVMRNNARSAWHESLPARSIIGRKVETVVDIGVRRECQPDDIVLGITPEEGEDWARDVEARFHLWASSKTCSRNEMLTFYQIQSLAYLHRKRDGEWFSRLFYNPRRDLTNSLQIQLLDPNQIGGNGYTNTAYLQDPQSDDGIIRDMDGRETGYEVYVKKADGTYTFATIPAKGRRSGRRMMLHGFTPEYAGQGRGFSSIGHAIQELENITDFSSASIKKAIIESSINLYVKPSKDAPASNPMVDQVSGPSSQYSPPEDPSGTTSSDDLTAGDSVDFSEVNEVDLRPGSMMIANLNSGEDLQSFTPSSPSEHFSNFYETFVGSLASSCGVPPEIVMMKFGENYSASRAVIVMFWRAALRDRMQEAADLYDPIFEIWLSGEIARGRISAPGWSDPVLRSAWLAGSWDGPPVPDIDPLKMAKANEINSYKLGATTLDDIAKGLTGTRGTTNRARLVKQIDEMPITPMIKTFGTAEEETDDEPEDEPAMEPAPAGNDEEDEE